MKPAPDSLYELEIAFSQIPDPGEAHCPAVAGGSHLPPHPGGRHRQHASRRVLHRQAVLARYRHRTPRPARTARLRDAAARAHEPDPAVAGARADRLVLEAAVHASARSHWGTQLHDQFMLPHFVARGFPRRAATICTAPAIRSKPNGSRRTSSFAIRSSARVNHAGIEIELRQATEPWYVLGEERSAGGTARYVDSSVERVQVQVDGLIERPLRDHLQRPPRAAAFDRHSRANGWRACAIAPGSRRRACIRRFRCTRRWSSMCSIPGPAGRSADAPITSRIRAAAATTRSR